VFGNSIDIKFAANICDFCPRRRVCNGKNCTVKKFRLAVYGKKGIGIVEMEFKD